MAQVTLTDNECRTTINTAFNNIRVVDVNNLTAYSYVLRLDTLENLNGKNTAYAGALKLFDDMNPAAEVLQAEMTVYSGTTLIQRTVADGKKVWSYDPMQNAYSVNAYNVELGNNSPRYRPDFINLFKQTAAGAPLNLMTLMDQASISGTARVKDWLGGISFTGQESIDVANPSHLIRQMWQSVPDNSRFVQFNTESYDLGITWTLVNIQVHRVDKVGSSVKTSDTYLTVAKDASNIPLTMVKNSPDFLFVPPARSKVLSTPRTVKF